jgi:phosphatidylglycerophosphate synthase
VLTGRDDYFVRWAALHGGYDPRGNVLVRWWLSGAYVVAQPVAGARVPPDAVTAGGLLVSGAVVAVAALGDGWALLAAGLVVLSGLLDNVDGAVAVLTGRTSRWGYVLDSVADRVGDVLYLVALAFLQEYTRARAAAAGMTEVGVVTLWERPTRVIVTASFLAATAVFGDPWPALAAGAWAGLGAIGFGQLLAVVHRRLR